MKYQATSRPKIPADDAKAWRKEARHYRRYLGELSNTTLAFLAQLDELMKQPSTYQRGQAISKLMNALEFANDGARHFGLGINLKRDKKLPVKVAKD
jgi:hypothetical protein